MAKLELDQLAHNALAGAVTMYKEIMDRYEQQLQLARFEIVSLRSQIAILKRPEAMTDALRKPSPTGEVPRDGRAGGDKPLDGRGMGQGDQGKETAREEKKQPWKVGGQAAVEASASFLRALDQAEEALPDSEPGMIQRVRAAEAAHRESTR
jgi:hypothetical protein